MIICKAKFVEVLFALDESPMSFNELKTKLKISPATLSRRISEMESNNLIVSKISKKDRKKIKYMLSDKGKRLIPIIRQIISLSKQIEGEFSSKRRKDS